MPRPFDTAHIADSFAPASHQSIATGHRAFFDALPADFRAFLARHNGGVVKEFAWTFDTGVPFKTDTVDNPSRDDCIVELFGIPTTPAPEHEPRDLLQAVADYEQACFLPRGVFAVASCSQNSLVCVSTRPEDVGHVYYWDWYWQYPWCEPFFRARIDEALRMFPDSELVSNDTNHPLHNDLVDTLNFATLVQLAPSWPDFLAKCRDERDLQA